MVRQAEQHIGEDEQPPFENKNCVMSRWRKIWIHSDRLCDDENVFACSMLRSIYFVRVFSDEYGARTEPFSDWLAIDVRTHVLIERQKIKHEHTSNALKHQMRSSCERQKSALDRFSMDLNLIQLSFYTYLCSHEIQSTDFSVCFSSPRDEYGMTGNYHNSICPISIAIGFRTQCVQSRGNFNMSPTQCHRNRLTKFFESSIHFELFQHDGRCALCSWHGCSCLFISPSFCQHSLI